MSTKTELDGVIKLTADTSGAKRDIKKLESVPSTIQFVANANKSIQNQMANRISTSSLLPPKKSVVENAEKKGRSRLPFRADKGIIDFQHAFVNVLNKSVRESLLGKLSNLGRGGELISKSIQQVQMDSEQKEKKKRRQTARPIKDKHENVSAFNGNAENASGELEGAGDIASDAAPVGAEGAVGGVEAAGAVGEGGAAVAGGTAASGVGIPIAIAAAGIAAAAAAAIGMAAVLKKTTEKLISFGKSVSDMSGSMMANFAIFGIQIKLMKMQIGNALAPAFKKMLDQVVNLAQKVLPLFIEVMKLVVHLVTAALKIVGELMDAFRNFYGAIKAIISPFISIWSKLSDVVKGVILAMFPIFGIVKIIKSVIDNLKTFSMDLEIGAKTFVMIIKSIPSIISAMAHVMTASTTAALRHPIKMAKAEIQLALGNPKPMQSLMGVNPLKPIFMELSKNIEKMVEEIKKQNEHEENKISESRKIRAANATLFYENFLHGKFEAATTMAEKIHRAAAEHNRASGDHMRYGRIVTGVYKAFNQDSHQSANNKVPGFVFN